MHGRPWIGERCDGGAIGELQDVFDVDLDAGRPSVGEDVRADLADGGFKEHEIAVIDRAVDRLAQTLNGLVENVQSFVKPGEVGTELKWLLGTPSLRSQ
jgi:hypothetical protein